MTRVTDRMLRRVEEALYPTEAMALWLRETKQEHRSLAELVASLKDQPEEAWPLITLTHQAETNANARLTSQAALLAGREGQRNPFLERNSRAAVRDAATLWYLFVNVNGRFMAEKRALYILLALLFSSYREWVLGREWRERDEPLDQRIRSALAELYAWNDAVALLVDRYFQGLNPLMPEEEESLNWIVEQTEQLAERFNDRLEWEVEARKTSRKRKSPLPKPIDIDAVRRVARQSAQAQANLQVDMARAEACEMMGEHKRALAFAERMCGGRILSRGLHQARSSRGRQATMQVETSPGS